MSDNTVRETIDGPDLQFRPRSYFWADELGIRLAGDIQGSRRKAMYEECLQTGEDMPEALMQPTLSSHLRQALGRFHPQMMGGEYLTRPKRGEVVLARLTIDSTTADTYAIYVRRAGNRLRYRAVDEYEGSSLGNKSTRSSTRPLTLAELVDFAMAAWGVTQCLEGNYADEGYPVDDCQDFLTELSSDFYADFEGAMRRKVGEWLDKVREPDDEGEEDGQ